MNEIKTVLCVDDDPDNCELLKVLLSGEGFHVNTTENMNEVLDYVKSGSISAVILDNKLKETSGVEITRAIRAFDQNTPIIFYSGAVYPKDIDSALESGAQIYLKKPLDFMKIPETVRQLLMPASLGCLI